MQIKVVCKNDNTFLFIEANADFVNLLTNIQHLPIGVLARIAGKGNTCSIFQNSCSNLGKHLFVIPKTKTLLLDNKTNLKELVENKVKKPIVKIPTLKTNNMTCNGNGNGPYTCMGNGGSNGYWDKAVAFRNLGPSFEITIKINSSDLAMLGILPDNSELESRLRTQNFYNSYGCFVHANSNANIYPQGGRVNSLFNNSTPQNGYELKMRFQQKLHKLEYSYNGNGWHEVTIFNGQYGNNNGTLYCPVLVTVYNDIVTVTNVKSLNEEPTSQEKEFFKTESTFLVTNDLMVSDSTSFSSHLQLLQKYNISNVLTLKTDTIEFNQIELKRLISAIIYGKQNVLEIALDEKQYTKMMTTENENSKYINGKDESPPHTINGAPDTSIK